MESFDPKNTARIHSLETFGTVDGPGIRFVIFFQGCPLRCQYCHNRDTWDASLGQRISLEAIVSKIERYLPYFQSSGGGVTLSGGEPLLQQDFVLRLLQELQKFHIHTAIDTSGMFTITPKLSEIIHLADLFLLDIKHMDPEMCKTLVGVSNEKELQFAKYLSEHQKPIWIRQVLIPGITDSENYLLALKEFIQSLSTVEKVELLKYHNMGKFKWDTIGATYELDHIRPATDEDIAYAKSILGLSS